MASPLPPAAASDAALFEVPTEFAILKELRRRDGSPFIVHIQDAHANYSGQLNLAHTLDALIKKYGISLILVEGSDRDVTLDLLREAAPSETVCRRGAKSLLMDGIISGEEYLNLTTHQPMRIIGIEDSALYERSIQSYAELAKRREKAIVYLQSIRTALDKLKRKRYPKPLQDYERPGASDKGPEASFSTLLKLAKDNKVPLEPYHDLSALAALQEKEERMDFEAANLELAALVEETAKRGGPGSMEDFIRNTLQTKNHKPSQALFFERALQEAGKKNIPLSGYPNLVAYTEHLRAFSKIEFDVFFTEKTALEDAVYAAVLAGDADARQIRAIDRYVAILMTAYRIQMTTQDFKMFKANEPDYATMASLAFLNRHLAELGYIEGLIPYDDVLEEGEKALVAFYDSVDKRDLAFMQNMGRTMRETGDTAAVLISGGYHTPHLKELFKERGYSYAVVAPIVTSETNQAKYEKILLSGVQDQTKEVRVLSSSNVEDSSTARQKGLAIHAARLAQAAQAMDVINIAPVQNIFASRPTHVKWHPKATIVMAPEIDTSSLLRRSVDPDDLDDRLPEGSRLARSISDPEDGDDLSEKNYDDTPMNRLRHISTHPLVIPVLEVIKRLMDLKDVLADRIKRLVRGKDPLEKAIEQEKATIRVGDLLELKGLRNYRIFQAVVIDIQDDQVKLDVHTNSYIRDPELTVSLGELQKAEDVTKLIQIGTSYSDWSKLDMNLVSLQPSGARMATREDVDRAAAAPGREEAITSFIASFKGSTPTLLEVLNDRIKAPKASRIFAIQVLGEMKTKDPSVITGLTDSLLNDPEPVVRLMAVVALNATQSGSLAALAEARAKDSDRRVRAYTVKGLHLLGTPAVPVLLEAMKDGDPIVRRLASEVLEKQMDAVIAAIEIDMSRKLPILTSTLIKNTAEDVRLRTNIAHFFAKLMLFEAASPAISSAPTVIQALVLASNDRDIHVQQYAGQALINTNEDIIKNGLADEQAATVLDPLQRRSIKAYLADANAGARMAVQVEVLSSYSSNGLTDVDYRVVVAKETPLSDVIGRVYQAQRAEQERLDRIQVRSDDMTRILFGGERLSGEDLTDPSRTVSGEHFFTVQWRRDLGISTEIEDRVLDAILDPSDEERQMDEWSGASSAAIEEVLKIDAETDARRFDSIGGELIGLARDRRTRSQFIRRMKAFSVAEPQAMELAEAFSAELGLELKDLFKESGARMALLRSAAPSYGGQGAAVDNGLALRSPKGVEGARMAATEKDLGPALVAVMERGLVKIMPSKVFRSRMEARLRAAQRIGIDTEGLRLREWVDHAVGDQEFYVLLGRKIRENRQALRSAAVQSDARAIPYRDLKPLLRPYVEAAAERNGVVHVYLNNKLLESGQRIQTDQAKDRLVEKIMAGLSPDSTYEIRREIGSGIIFITSGARMALWSKVYEWRVKRWLKEVRHIGLDSVAETASTMAPSEAISYLRKELWKHRYAELMNIATALKLEMLELLGEGVEADTDKELSLIGHLLGDREFLLKAAEAAHNGYYQKESAKTGNPIPAFATSDQKKAYIDRQAPEVAQNVAIQIAGLIALVDALAHLTSDDSPDWTLRRLTPSQVLDRLLKGELSRRATREFLVMANNSWRAQQPTRDLSRVERKVFQTLFPQLSAEEVAKDLDQIRSAAKILSGELVPAVAGARMAATRQDFEQELERFVTGDIRDVSFVLEDGYQDPLGIHVLEKPAGTLLAGLNVVFSNGRDRWALRFIDQPGIREIMRKAAIAAMDAYDGTDIKSAYSAAKAVSEQASTTLDRLLKNDDRLIIQFGDETYRGVVSKLNDQGFVLTDELGVQSIITLAELRSAKVDKFEAMSGRIDRPSLSEGQEIVVRMAGEVYWGNVQKLSDNGFSLRPLGKAEAYPVTFRELAGIQAVVERPIALKIGARMANIAVSQTRNNRKEVDFVITALDGAVPISTLYDALLEAENAERKKSNLSPTDLIEVRYTMVNRDKQNKTVQNNDTVTMVFERKAKPAQARGADARMERTITVPGPWNPNIVTRNRLPGIYEIGQLGALVSDVIASIEANAVEKRLGSVRFVVENADTGNELGQVAFALDAKPPLAKVTEDLQRVIASLGETNPYLIVSRILGVADLNVEKKGDIAEITINVASGARLAMGLIYPREDFINQLKAKGEFSGAVSGGLAGHWNVVTKLVTLQDRSIVVGFQEYLSHDTTTARREKVVASVREIILENTEPSGTAGNVVLPRDTFITDESGFPGGVNSIAILAPSIVKQMAEDMQRGLSVEEVLSRAREAAIQATNQQRKIKIVPVAEDLQQHLERAVQRPANYIEAPQVIFERPEKAGARMSLDAASGLARDSRTVEADAPRFADVYGARLTTQLNLDPASELAHPHIRAIYLNVILNSQAFRNEKEKLMLLAEQGILESTFVEDEKDGSTTVLFYGEESQILHEHRFEAAEIEAFRREAAISIDTRSQTAGTLDKDVGTLAYNEEARQARVFLREAEKLMAEHGLALSSLAALMEFDLGKLVPAGEKSATPQFDRNIQVLIKALEAMSLKYPRVRFLFTGPSELLDYARRAGVDSFEATPAEIADKELPRLQATDDKSLSGDDGYLILEHAPADTLFPALSTLAYAIYLLSVQKLGAERVSPLDIADRVVQEARRLAGNPATADALEKVHIFAFAQGDRKAIEMAKVYAVRSVLQLFDEQFDAYLVGMQAVGAAA